jgi:hypothetical protein
MGLEGNRPAKVYASWDFKRFIILCGIWDGMGHIRNKPTILMWPVDKEKYQQETHKRINGRLCVV